MSRLVWVTTPNLENNREPTVDSGSTLPGVPSVWRFSGSEGVFRGNGGGLTAQEERWGAVTVPGNWLMD
jgi:hypothetical protein